MTGTELPQTTPTVQERLSYIKPGENVFNANMPEHLRLKVKGATISQLYKRLHPDKPSYTVIGAGGGGTHTSTTGKKTAHSPTANAPASKHSPTPTTSSENAAQSENKSAWPYPQQVHKSSSKQSYEPSKAKNTHTKNPISKSNND